MNPISRVQNKTSKSPKSNAITPKPCLRPRVPQMASQLRSPHRSPPLPTRIPRRPQPIWMLLNKLNLLRHIPLTLLATWSAVLRHLNPITPDAEMPLPDHRPPVRSKTWWRSVVRTVAHAVATGESIHAAIGWRCSVVTPRIGVDDAVEVVDVVAVARVEEVAFFVVALHGWSSAGVGCVGCAGHDRDKNTMFKKSYAASLFTQRSTQNLRHNPFDRLG
jgi:hypothetical protein